jgi:N-acetyllactosaminide beta-1,3-N-acetylglucosaminyltransferase
MKPLQNYDLGLEKYPNNLLRNVAARYVNTDYIMVLDIDIVPSANLFEQFVEFARRGSFSSETASLDAQTVYVVPVFELQRGVELPQDKASLSQLWDQGQVRPFYYELCWKCQKHTDYMVWKNLTHYMKPGTQSKSLSAQYQVEWKDPWEPFYIGPRHSLPGYDERFKQFGFNRISQVSRYCV